MARDDPPPLEDMTQILKRCIWILVNNLLTESIQPKAQLNPCEEIVQNVPQKVLRHTIDKTSLVSITPSNPILITNDVSKPVSKVEPPSPSKPLEPLKRGFFNATPKPKKSKSKAITKEEIPFIRPTKSKEENNIPVEDPERIALQKEVQEMLVPTQELVKDVMETTDIKNSLEDPEIMAAVSEIAGNPDALLKYKHNKKITDFYNHLGKLMKDGMDKQDKMANSKK